MRVTNSSSFHENPAMPHIVVGLPSLSFLLEIALFSIPLCGSSQSLFQSDFWLVPEVFLGSFDTEGSILTEPIHATPKKRRVYVEGFVRHFAGQGGGP